MKPLKQAVCTYAARHANRDGLALTPVQGLRMMYVHSSQGALHSIYKPLVCLVLQGAKHMMVGLDERTISAGQSVIVTADMPVVGRILEASPSAPYVAIAIELEMSILRDVTTQLGGARTSRGDRAQTLLTQSTDAEVLDCAARLMRLVDKPDAIPVLRAAILRELHYWLLSGAHGETLRALTAPENYTVRLNAAIALLRREFRSRLSMEQLAAAASMSLSAFHKHFKRLTSLTPGQYQKRLRLIEARRLMLDEGFSASRAAFEVGYESASQFTREYRRMFQMPPKQDALRVRAAARTGDQRSRENGRTIGAV
jgi:AraC-like DNA-binding protein